MNARELMKFLATLDEDVKIIQPTGGIGDHVWRVNGAPASVADVVVATCAVKRVRDPKKAKFLGAQWLNTELLFTIDSDRYFTMYFDGYPDLVSVGDRVAVLYGSQLDVYSLHSPTGGDVIFFPDFFKSIRRREP